MEIIEVKSAHSLVSSVIANRPVGAHSYKINTRQYVTTYRNWARSEHPPTQPCGIMTLDYERIWLTEHEGKQIADAIQASRTPVLLVEQPEVNKDAPA